MTVNDQQIEQFMQTFLGYGNLESDFWFIGMEEGGGNTVEEIQARLSYWIEGGCKVVEDVAEYHQKFGMGYFFDESPKNQPTWNKLIRIILALEQQPLSLNCVKAFQKDRLARQGGDNCLLELFPLPSPSVGHWLYSEVSALDYLASRDRYKAHLQELRIELLREKIAKYKPKLVVFYGNNPEYRQYWGKIADCELTGIEIEGRPAFKAFNGETLYLVVSHPVATGITNDYFHRIGDLARTHLETVVL
ncbi:hypothetical protein SAMN04487965_0949 [Microbulbifer donghaiensis]|uniref:Uracil DNA glycosylase superfamily protein n=1 Tax=Microbulbifer donghaiensis TaxID=494016 RepID=A0A1M4XFB2_9GAMM|nr:hypothetical protein [Microbulbifer donghaiensis]SHE91996.1 hypothetical protein SAMN04487965_0949 [Microbulbifer donghaiensis]